MSSTSVTEQRYGRPDPWRRRLLLGVVAVLVIAGAGWLAWTTWVASNPEVESELISFEVIDDTAVQATLGLSFADDEVAATCTLRAYAEDHGVVGQLSFEPDSIDGRVTQIIRTDRLATAVEKVGCTAPGQDRVR